MDRIDKIRCMFYRFPMKYLFPLLLVGLMAASILGAQSGSEKASLKDFAYLKQEIKKNSDNPDLYYALAIRYNQMNYPFEAQKCLLTALYLNPKDFKSMLALGQIRRKVGVLSGAREILQKLVTEDQKNAAAWTELAYTCIRSGRQDEAIQALRKAINVSPETDVPKLHYYIGIVALAQGNLKSVEEELDWLREKKSNYSACLEKCRRLTE